MPSASIGCTPRSTASSTCTQYDEFVCPADDDHVWVDIDWLRTSGVALVGDADYATNFDVMIAYATTKGWLDDSGRCVRAHIAR